MFRCNKNRQVFETQIVVTICIVGEKQIENRKYRKACVKGGNDDPSALLEPITEFNIRRCSSTIAKSISTR